MAISFSDAKKIPIVDYLSRLGIEPVKIRGHDYWYHSPFRHDRDPSLKVNNNLNLWYDHGSGEGGTIVDLGAKLHDCSLHDFLDKLDTGGNTFPIHQRPSKIPESKLDILSVAPLRDSHLLNYLQDRCISEEVAKAYCQEVSFTIAKKQYNAIGFKNRSNGYELRNRWFKGSSSPKDVSLINNGYEKLCVMEGFIDFLSTQSYPCSPLSAVTEKSDFMILNSLSFLNKNVDTIKSYDEVVAFLDNDQAGKNAKSMLQDKGIHFKDASDLYKGFKDVNEFVVSEMKNQNTTKRSKGIKP